MEREGKRGNRVGERGERKRARPTSIYIHIHIHIHIYTYIYIQYAGQVGLELNVGPLVASAAVSVCTIVAFGIFGLQAGRANDSDKRNDSDGCLGCTIVAFGIFGLQAGRANDSE